MFVFKSLVPFLALFFTVIACAPVTLTAEQQLPDADPQAGRAALTAYGCGACHTIPGVEYADARVGPSLAGLAEQSYLAGKLPNTAENLVRWIRDPQGIDPGVVMPDLGVTEDEARNMAAYLYSPGRADPINLGILYR
jgi:cytochrome c2